MIDDEKTATQAEETAIQPENDAPDTAQEQTPPKDAETENDKSKKPAWFTRVIAREAAEKREAKREADALRAQLAAVIEDQARDPNKASRALTQAEIDRLANTKAQEISDAKEFNRACNDVAEKGEEEFDDFTASVGTLQQMGGDYQGLLRIATELDDAHKILYHLGQNPEEAERLLSLPPTKMAIAVAKIETQLNKAGVKTISDVPPPIKPIKTVSNKTFDPNDPNADRNEWSKWREKTRRKR